MESRGMSEIAKPTDSGAESSKPCYEVPSIRVMDETEVLSAFQVAVAGVTWWVM